jgi:hypothetical protein
VQNTLEIFANTHVLHEISVSTANESTVTVVLQGIETDALISADARETKVEEVRQVTDNAIGVSTKGETVEEAAIAAFSKKD